MMYIDMFKNDTVLLKISLLY